MRRFLRGDRGSMAVEFVVAAPALVLLLLLVSAGGQWLNLTGKVGSAARDAVRAASVARTFADGHNRSPAAKDFGSGENNGRVRRHVRRFADRLDHVGLQQHALAAD